MNGTMKRARLVACMVALMVSGTAIAQDAQSGFLRDYSNLANAKDSEGKPIRIWASAKFTPARYNAVLLDPVIFYPEPRPSPQVSAAELQNMVAYLNSALKQSLGKRFALTDRAGPGVVRIRIAVTGVAAKGEGLKPYQVTPVAFLATMAMQQAEGGAPQKAALVVESEASDSVTGELLSTRLRAATGERLARASKVEVITLEAVKPILDELAENAFVELPKYVKSK